VCIAIFTVEYLGRVLSVPFSSFLDNSTQLGIDIFKRKHVYLGDSRGNRLWNYVTEVLISHSACRGHPHTRPSCGRAADGCVCVCEQVMNLIDLLAIVPFYIEIAVGNGSQLQFLRVMRLTRVVRWRRPSQSVSLSAPASRQLRSRDSRHVSHRHTLHLSVLKPIAGATVAPHLS
jgi:hypothetical protein